MSQIAQINSLALLNVSDDISRKRDGKFGVLLGTIRDEIIIVATTFELKLKENLVDWEHLHKQLTLSSTVLPQYKLVGLYQISDRPEPNNSTFSILEQFVDSTPFIYTIFGFSHNQNGTKITEQNNYVKSFNYATHEPVQTVIHTNSIESAATSTIVNSKHYTDESKESDDTHNEGLRFSIEQLEQKVEKLLSFKVETDNLSKSLEINNLITHLSNKLNSFKNLQIDATDDLSYQSSQLSLLTSQLTALENLKANICKNIIRFGLNNRAVNQINQLPREDY